MSDEILAILLVPFLLGTMALHMIFWADFGKGDIEKSLIGCMFTLPFFPIFGIIQIIRGLPFTIKIEKKNDKTL